MFVEIAELLSKREVDYIVNLSLRAKFVDGKVSNPNNKEKNNLQISLNDNVYHESSRIAHFALKNNKEVARFAFPRHIGLPMLTKYTEGMYYGLHCDTPFGWTGIRSDISCTIFLYDPETYDGGELRVHLGNGQIDFKLRAGSAVLYPSNTLHEVLPVTRGERLAMICFTESSIADPTHRDILYQVNSVKRVEKETLGWDSRTRLNYVAASLERMWSTK